jgi:excisionase family DNA binding protein
MARSKIDDDVLDAVQAAALLKVHVVTLRKRAAAWGVPHRRLGSEWRFSKKMLIEWLQSGEGDLPTGHEPAACQQSERDRRYLQ